MIRHAIIVAVLALVSTEITAAVRMIQAAVVPLAVALGGDCGLGDACRKPAVAMIVQNEDSWTSSPLWVRCQLFAGGAPLGTRHSRIVVLRADAHDIISIQDIPSNTTEARCTVEGGR
jgi:hypothetical protein